MVQFGIGWTVIGLHKDHIVKCVWSLKSLTRFNNVWHRYINCLSTHTDANEPNDIRIFNQGTHASQMIHVLMQEWMYFKMEMSVLQSTSTSILSTTRRKINTNYAHDLESMYWSSQRKLAPHRAVDPLETYLYELKSAKLWSTSECHTNADTDAGISAQLLAFFLATATQVIGIVAVSRTEYRFSGEQIVSFIAKNMKCEIHTFYRHHIQANC